MAPRPEILAPAGDAACLHAAVGAGADAVYFGLASGFNARAKAKGFTEEELPQLFDWLHQRGVAGYVTFNTLVFDAELPVAAELIATIARAGADALIVQDLGVARLAHAIAPELPLHASTQMTVSSSEGAAIAAELGIARVILPRELSIEQIRRFRATSCLELECFIHGALCVSYSGQCLTSEAWGQRSANRGQCAQSCRLPYQLLVDGLPSQRTVERYLLSPKDLAAYNLVGALCDAGVSCFKIEGRYKGPDYVAATVEKYRRVLDGVLAGTPVTLGRQDIEDLAYSFSRGFSPGWLLGDNHQELSHGQKPGHRGLLVGTVTQVSGYRVWVQPAPDAPTLKPGDWMVFEQGEPELDEPRGSIFSLGLCDARSWEIRFGEPGPELSRVRVGDTLWKTHDEAVKRRLLRYQHEERKLPVHLEVVGKAQEPLRAHARDALGRKANATSAMPLSSASGTPLDRELLRSKLGAFGQTPFCLTSLDVHIEGALALPPSELKRMRRSLSAALLSQEPPRPTYRVNEVDPHHLVATPQPQGPAAVGLVPLCRTLEQVDACLSYGVGELYLDFMELLGLKEAVRRCRARGARVVIATMRVQKPGEEPIDKRFFALAPDGMLARHLGALHYFRKRLSPNFSLHGDFSLNASNALTARTLLGFGLTTLTPAYDLDIEQLCALATVLPKECLEITLHQHLPLYHTEYCVYAHNLSSGVDYRDCGRPCEAHRLSLRDSSGRAHPVQVDVNCRNTVFEARAQTAAHQLQRLRALGLQRFRIELVWESATETTRILRAYDDLLANRIAAADLKRRLGTIERYGVTAGTLAVARHGRLPTVG